jgi:hypothetical protein
MDTIAKLYNICNPLKPPTKETYVDLCSARGGTSVVSVLERRIRKSDPENKTYTRLLFSGHLGSGKSTELLRLCEQIKNSPTDRLFPIYMDASKYINYQDVEITEILLALVSSVAETLKQEENIDLEPPYLKKLFGELKDIALSDVELEKAEFSIDKFAKFIFKLKQADNSTRKEVRSRLKPKLSTFLDEINLILSQARVELMKRGYRDLVLIIDNLEKITDDIDPETGHGTYYRIFNVGGQQLCSIEANAVFTVPLPLIYSSERSPIVQKFGEEPIVLPMVKVEDKKGSSCEDGLELMREVLRKRFEVSGISESDVFDSQDIFTNLCHKSGGHVRNLLIYFRSASDYIDKLPFTKEAVQKGIQQHINAYSRSIQENNWELLAKLQLNQDKDIPNDDAHKNMLGDLSILQYMNGGEPWYSVNPVIRELEKFKRAVEKLKNNQAS